jgi:hypothetical protein
VSELPLPPLDPELASLLDAERLRAGAPPGVEAEVFASVARVIRGVPPPGGGPGHGSGQGSGGTPAAPLGASGVPGAATAADVAGGLGAKALLARFGPAALLGFLLGGIAGSQVQARLDARFEPIASVAVTSAPAAPAAPEPEPSVTVGPLTLPAASAAPESPSSSVHPTREVSETKSAETDEELRAERALIDTARSAIQRGDGAAALDAVTQHAKRFPKGQLAEEREVLAIEALASAGRVQEAADRAGRFRLRYPESVLLPVVDEALRTH